MTLAYFLVVLAFGRRPSRVRVWPRLPFLSRLDLMIQVLRCHWLAACHLACLHIALLYGVCNQKKSEHSSGFFYMDTNL